MYRGAFTLDAYISVKIYFTFVDFIGSISIIMKVKAARRVSVFNRLEGGFVKKQSLRLLAFSEMQSGSMQDIYSWFCESGFTILTKLEGHTKNITGIALPSGSEKLYSVSKDRTIRIWDCNSGQCASAVDLDGEVGCLISEGPWLFAGLPNAIKEGAILAWKWGVEANIPELAATMKGHNGAVCSLLVGDNTRLYSGSSNNTIWVWDLQMLQCMQTLHGHTGDVASVICWDRYLLSASADILLKESHFPDHPIWELDLGLLEDLGMEFGFGPTLVSIAEVSSPVELRAVEGSLTCFAALIIC
ncbi:unnamed protein product [Fraxinus pennsylvanica]|uniref:Uncharacterized protein n=1 Tax=Fraxinus pennsylvanica TaxID=56036 RepID=A0AAD2DIU3_9LAMI|nr:unnamed protein product [Fraxinus pennsylvanica]